MSYALRTLDPTADGSLYQEAYSWILTSPDWFQYLEGIISTVNNCYSFTDYLNAATKPTEFNVGLFSGKLKAMFTIQDQQDGSFQIHVAADRQVDQSALVAGAVRLREWLFEHGAREIFGWIASVNRPMKKFAEQAGFAYCGVSVFKGSLNDRPIRWLRYQAVR